jgi:hypothetical protein
MRGLPGQLVLSGDLQPPRRLTPGQSLWRAKQIAEQLRQRAQADLGAPRQHVASDSEGQVLGNGQRQAGVSSCSITGSLARFSRKTG